MLTPMPKPYRLLFISLSVCYGLSACATSPSSPATLATNAEIQSSTDTDLVVKTNGKTRKNTLRHNTEQTPQIKAVTVLNNPSAATLRVSSHQVSNTTANTTTAISINPITDLWARIRTGFTFDTDYPSGNPAIDQRVEKYINRLQQSPSLQKAVTANARPYLYFIVNELEKHNIPLEIALLPIVESRYDPFAYSPGRASGLWQFIPSTGKRFGLTQNWWQDERRDTISATGAAIQYLLYLYQRFDNDWLLALAAYNAGEGTVARAIGKNKKQNKATDYWSLQLPQETQMYIPKLLAWRTLLQNPDSYDMKLNPIANTPYFAIVDIGSQIDLAEAAELAAVDIDTIYQLNPAYNRWATDPKPPHNLLVPIDQQTILEKALAHAPAEKRMAWTRYIIRPNDALIKIAKKFNTTPKLIASLNGLQTNTIRAGDALLVPSAAKPSDYYSKSATQRLVRKQQSAKKNNAQAIEHWVKPGETLWDLGKTYGVSANAIARWNNMAPRDTLRIKQKLVIWIPKNSATTPKNEIRKLFYKVKSGDSLAFISQKFKVKINDIKRWNRLQQQRYIQPGQLLTLYVSLTDRTLY